MDTLVSAITLTPHVNHNKASIGKPLSERTEESEDKIEEESELPIWEFGD